jgi:putative ABC transport system substrate-binding protein
MAIRIRRRKFIVTLGGAAAAWPFGVRAQQGEEIHRIGFLANDPTLPTQAAGEAFLESLREHGFVEGKNIIIERRFAHGNSQRSSELAAELIQLNVGLIVASGQNNIAALSQRTKSTPVVMVNVFDPIGMGIVGNLASPGTNFTGLTSAVSIRLLGKRLQLLKDPFPRISRLAVLRTPNFPTDHVQWDWLERAASAFNVKLIAVSINGYSDLDAAFAALRRERADALYGLNNPLTLILRKQITELAAKERLPAIYPFTEVAEAGGLMSYGASRPDLFRRAATYAAKILSGAKAADLPIEQPTKFELVINLTTAKALALTIPAGLLALADKVIQ